MSNLGFHQVYSLINALPEVVCERGFLEPELSGTSFETARPLGAFDVLAFALPFELNYLGMLRLLDESGVGARSDERGTDRPLIIAGGVAVTANPEPLADFADAFVLGDAEPVIAQVMDAVMRAGRRNRKKVLDALVSISGVYVPARYKPIYTSDGDLTGYETKGGAPMPLTRSVAAADDPHVPARTVVHTGNTEFGGAFLVEVSRGCARRCRFCLASALAPCRFFPADRILAAVPDAETAPKLGLVGASVSDYPRIETLVSSLVDRGHSVTLSSLRPDAATEPLLAALVRGGRKSVTFAPEVGSPAMAKTINKQFAEGAVARAVTASLRAGLRNVKLYFMIGLPGETDDDATALVEMVRRLAGDVRGLQCTGRPVGSLAVTVSFFVPKPLTAFENVPMCPATELRRRMRDIQGRLRDVSLVNARTTTLRWTLVQAVLSRGDRRAGRLIETLARDGTAPGVSVRRWIETAPAPAIFGFEPGMFHPWDIVGGPQKG
jgi:radical SAM superfamily enzyme YgiQ (UPF0313 family)